jgi:hypothetical protein
MEVPPNIEVEQIVSTFSTLLSYSSNPALLKDDSKLLPFPGCWQAICKYDLHDPGHHTKHIRVNSKQELKERILLGIREINDSPVVHRWNKFDFAHAF